MTSVTGPGKVVHMSTYTKSNKSKPASEKQVAFVQSLIAERPAFAQSVGLDAEGLSLEGITMTEASNLINDLKAQPREINAKTDKPMVTEAGFYYNNDDDAPAIFRVRPAKSTGKLYAERLVVAKGFDDKGRFEYEYGLIKNIDPTWLLTLEQAKAIGRQFGFCVRCGALLEDPKSVEQGIGPWCAKKWAA